MAREKSEEKKKSLRPRRLSVREIKRRFLKEYRELEEAFRELDRVDRDVTRRSFREVRRNA